MTRDPSAEATRLCEFIFAAWNDQVRWSDMALLSANETVRAALADAWVAAIASGAFDDSHFAHSIATALFIHPHTPRVVLEAAIARWRGTPNEVVATWLSHPATPVSYVCAVVALHRTLPEHLAEAVARYPEALRDPAVRRVMRKSRGLGAWAALWATAESAERATIMDSYLAHAPHHALAALAAEAPATRPPVTKRRIAELLGHRNPAVRTQTLTLLVPEPPTPDAARDATRDAARTLPHRPPR